MEGKNELSVAAFLIKLEHLQTIGTISESLKNEVDSRLPVTDPIFNYFLN